MVQVHRPGFGTAHGRVAVLPAPGPGAAEFGQAFLDLAARTRDLEVVDPGPGILVLGLDLDVDTADQSIVQRGRRSLARTEVRLGAKVTPSRTDGSPCPQPRPLWASRSREHPAGASGAFHHRPADLRDEALEDLAIQVARLLLPWKETRSLVFIPEPCPQAFALLEAGDAEGALRAALEALRLGPAPELRAAACYDAGVLLCLRGAFAAASELLAEARELEPRSVIVREAWEACRRELALDRVGRG